MMSDPRDRTTKMHFAGHISILHKGTRTLINSPTRGGTPVCQTTSPNASWAFDRGVVTCKRCLHLIQRHDETSAAAKAKADGVWHPPFCANEVENLECPHCEDGGAVRVREKETYFDGDEHDAYCADCHAELTVTANVEVTFSDVEAVVPRPTQAKAER